MTEPLTVMIVDDASDLRELIGTVIGRHAAGWTVVATAEQGLQAVVVMRSGHPFATAGAGALAAGAHGYLEKSDLVRGLIPRLQKIIQGNPRGED